MEQASTSSDNEKIHIMLHEYDTLRQEILARTGHGFQIAIAAVALFVFIMLRGTWGTQFWLAIAAVLTLVAIGSWFTLRDINKAATNIRRIEQEINGRVGEQLLVWEKQWGAATTGFFSYRGLPDDQLKRHVGISRLKIFWTMDKTQVVIIIVAVIAAVLSLLAALQPYINIDLINSFHHIFGYLFSPANIASAAEMPPPSSPYTAKSMLTNLSTVVIIVFFSLSVLLTLYSKDAKRVAMAERWATLFSGIIVGAAKGNLGL